jgi:FAD/FMN-containing dehydrogenase
MSYQGRHLRQGDKSTDLVGQRPHDSNVSSRVKGKTEMAGKQGEAADRQAGLIAQLRGCVRGQVIVPGDSEYDAARTVLYGGIDRHPAVVVRVADANDVSQVVTLAQEGGWELAIRGGGHSLAGHGVSEGGIVLDLSAMRALEVDADAHVAWAEAGLTAGEVTAGTAEHGLAIGFGDTGSVGIGGITLGGGIGYFVRKYGLTIDDLLAAEVVTADGQIRQVDADSHPDLFWAIRGGGGNFGAVTRFKFRLHEVDTVVGGMLILPARPDVLLGFVAAAEAAPEELSTIVNVMNAPPMPFLPAELHGKLVTMGMLVYAGEVEAGQRAVAPFRALAEPLADMLRPMPYPEIYPPEQEGYHPMVAARTLLVDSFDQQAADTVFDYLGRSTAQMTVAQVRVLGGAMARVPVEATAFAHRQRRMMVSVLALYQDPGERDKHEAWAADFAAALGLGEAGAYANFLGDEGQARIRAAYPGPTWDRLAAVKARYDPTNLFRLNQNILPVKG